MRSSFSSLLVSLDSFQVLVRWKVMPWSSRIWRRRSLPILILRTALLLS